MERVKNEDRTSLPTTGDVGRRRFCALHRKYEFIIILADVNYGLSIDWCSSHLETPCRTTPLSQTPTPMKSAGRGCVECGRVRAIRPSRYPNQAPSDGTGPTTVF